METSRSMLSPPNNTAIFTPDLRLRAAIVLEGSSRFRERALVLRVIYFAADASRTCRAEGDAALRYAGGCPLARSLGHRRGRDRLLDRRSGRDGGVRGYRLGRGACRAGRALAVLHRGARRPADRRDADLRPAPRVVALLGRDRVELARDRHLDRRAGRPRQGSWP